MTKPTDESGQLVVAHPVPQEKTLKHYLLLYAIFPILAPAFITFKCITNSDFRKKSFGIYSLVSTATRNPISKEWYFQDKTLLEKMWKLASAQCFIDKSAGKPLLEYQIMEGYCGSATQRCILQSLGYPPDSIPPQKSGETKPEPWCEHIVKMAKESTHKSADETEGEFELETKIVRGNVTYEEFLATLREGTANTNCRIAVNFLRPALVGFQGVRWIPMNLVLGLFGGHFSPILGLVEQEEGVDGKKEIDNPFVAIWDTNHKYNGAYFVPARRLYDAVNAIDLSASKHRALVVVEKKKI